MMHINPFQPTLKILSLSVKEADSRVKITARQRGLFAAILHNIGLGNEYEFHINANGFRHFTSNFMGRTHVFCPKEHVSASVYMLQKPIIWIILAFVLAFPTFGIGTVICLIVYLFSKESVLIGFLSDGGTAETIRLQADPDERKKLEKAHRILESLIGGSADGGVGSGADDEGGDYAADDDAGAAAPPPAPAKTSTSMTTTVSCPHCRAQLKAPASMKGKTVSCPTCKQTFQV